MSIRRLEHTKLAVFVREKVQTTVIIRLHRIFIFTEFLRNKKVSVSNKYFAPLLRRRRLFDQSVEFRRLQICLNNYFYDTRTREDLCLTSRRQCGPFTLCRAYLARALNFSDPVVATRSFTTLRLSTSLGLSVHTRPGVIRVKARLYEAHYPRLRHPQKLSNNQPLR